MFGDEIRRVAARSGVLGALRRDAQDRRCALGVYDAAGTLLSADGPFVGTSGSAGADGFRIAGLAADAAPVRVFERVAGWVASAPQNGAVPAGTTGGIAARGADLLSDACTREFELDDLSREILGTYEELNLFYELSADLAEATDAAAISRVVLRKAAHILGAASAWVLLADRHGTLRPAASHRPPQGSGDVEPGQGVAGRCARTLTTDSLDDASSLPAGTRAGWETAISGPLLSVPLGVPGREDHAALGVLQVARPRGGAPFTAGETKLASALASHAAVLVENQRVIALERELSIARTIQQSLLPQRPPCVPGLDVAGRCLAAASVGGDYYDHFGAADGTLGVVVADVSGHDLAAALVQASARATIRSQAMADRAPARVLDGTNRALFEDLSRADMYLTAWIAVVDGASGRVAFADAGHPPALVFRAATGAVDPISAGGVPIGVIAEATYAQGATVLAAGDVLVAFTDGLTEARAPDSGEEYGPERLADALRAAAALPAEGIADALLSDVARFDGGAAAPDDRSLVVVKMRGLDSR